MCIRDSGEEVAEFLEVFGVDRDTRRHRMAAEADQQAGGAPVSYTHLRAHETVLDLVCRLLLEKKNKRRKTSELHCNQKNKKTAVQSTDNI